MKKTSRKILSVLLAVIMVLSIVPMAGVTSFAETSGDYEYKVLSETDKTCEITDYTGSATELAILSELNGYTVTSIGWYAFSDCTSLTSVTIPDNVTKIGEYAFGYIDDENNMNKIEGFTIYGYTGTAAETYANENGFTFINLDGVANVSMHRLYNPNSGEHFYTADVNEKNNLVSVGWKYEGIGWNAPETSDKPVYRLYNQNGGEHHYTLDASERDFLVSLGWKFEDIGWYSADTDGIPLYRQYNPNAFANNHNYTADKFENDWLVGLGRKAEGIGWYGVA